MKKEMKKVPAVRFTGFTGDWEQRKLGEIADKVTSKNKEHRYKETLTNSAEQGIVSQKEYFDHSISNIENINGYYVVEDNDFVYNPRISTSAPVGPINRNKLGRTGVMSPLYTVFKPHEIDESYLEWFFKSSHWYKFMYLNGDTGARSDRFAIKDSVFFKMPISVPTFEEQYKVGDFLNEADHLLTLNQQKLDQLKKLKAYFLQNLFPAKGEKVPKIRFKGFTDDWEQRKIFELFKITRGHVLASPLISDTKTGDKPYPVFSSQTKNNGLMGYYKDYLYQDAITWTTDGANAGTVNYRAEKFYCTNVCGVLLANKVIPNQMIAEALNKVAKRHVSYVGNPKLMNNAMADIEITLPDDENEQKRISYLFDKIDNLITLHQRKLEALQTLKKFLLQNLFV